MDRGTKKERQAEPRYDWQLHATTRHRNATQIDLVPRPQFPGTGTARISALLAAASGRPTVAPGPPVVRPPAAEGTRPAT